MKMSLTSLLFLSMTLNADPNHGRPFTVCEILDHLDSYREKSVTVRGEIYRSEEGTWMSGEGCAKPLVTKGYVWSSQMSIHLTPPYSASVESAGSAPLPVKIDSASTELLKKNAADTSTRIWETVRGRLETRTNFEMILWGNGKKYPLGYGHLGLSPAQIVLQEIKDVVINKAPVRK